MERNRASARVRRQRKKDMVDLYEREVARLERAIKTLQMHVWGGGEGVALAEALGKPNERSYVAEDYGKKGGGGVSPYVSMVIYVFFCYSSYFVCAEEKLWNKTAVCWNRKDQQICQCWSSRAN